MVPAIVVRAHSGMRAVSSFGSAILAYLAIRGFAISSLTPASRALTCFDAACNYFNIDIVTIQFTKDSFSDALISASARMMGVFTFDYYGVSKGCQAKSGLHLVILEPDFLTSVFENSP